MSVVGKPRSYYKQFAFTIEIPGIQFTGFQKCGEIKGEVATIEQWEGGALAAEKSPGRYKAADVTLERGATKDKDLWKWWKQVSNIAANQGAVDDTYKRTLDVVQRDRDGTELCRWTLHDAWPNAFVAGQWDNTADANVMESVTLVYKYFDTEDEAS